MLAPAFLVCVHAIVRNLAILVLESGLFFGFSLNSFLSASHLTLARAITLILTFAMAVFRSLTFWSGSILIWHSDYLLPVVGE